MSNEDSVLVSYSFSIGYVGAVREGEFEIERDEWDGLTTQQREDMIDEMLSEEISNYLDSGWNVENADINDPTRED